MTNFLSQHRSKLLPLGALAFAAVATTGAFASNHREAPITALDQKADITDLYAFVSYDENQMPGAMPEKATFILCVDPLLEPSNGPTLFPFDPNILYEIKVDNDHDAEADLAFQFRFSTQFQLPTVYTAVAGIGPNGASNPNTGALVVPPRILGFDDIGLNQRQTYTVTMVDIATGVQTPITNTNGAPFYSVPGNAGPRTMDYESLFDQATYGLAGGISVFAGTVDDPFFIDLGAAFDTANFRTLGSGVPGVLTSMEDSAAMNFASDMVSGFAVNSIAIELPIEMLTATGLLEPASSPFATIGIYATTSRPQITVRNSPDPISTMGAFSQVQRFGNPLINELVIGIGSKDRFSMDLPKNDAQFISFFRSPPIVAIVEALYGGALSVPKGPRRDLTPLLFYQAPIAAPNTPLGPVADLMRLNTGVSATPPATASRLGLIGGDAAGYPNGRRLADDVVDITLRVVVGGVLAPPFPGFTPGINDRLGDGVNVNDAPLRTSFPYLPSAPSGRDRRHIDPGEPGGGPIQ